MKYIVWLWKFMFMKTDKPIRSKWFIYSESYDGLREIRGIKWE